MEKGDGVPKERRGAVAGEDGSIDGVHDPEEGATAADATGWNPFSSSRRPAAIGTDHLDGDLNLEVHHMIAFVISGKKNIFFLTNHVAQTTKLNR